MSSDEIAQRLQELQHRPRLVVLAACHQGTLAHDSQADPALVALGPRLARVGVPAVVAMRGSVALNTVSRFLPAFFEQIDQHGEIDRAMSLARGKIRGQPDAHKPLLFMRLRSGKIWYTGGFADDPRGAGDRKWHPLIASLSDQRCTPILGPDIAEAIFGTRRELAWRLAEDFQFPLEPHNREDLPQVAQYLSINKDESSLPRTLVEYLLRRLERYYPNARTESLRQASLRRPSSDELLQQLDALMTEVWEQQSARNPGDVHRVLARLPIPIYITAEPSNLLVNALRRAGREPQIMLCPWNDYTFEQIRDQTIEPSVERPLVYYLYGRLQESKSLVLTEDAFFDYLIGVTKYKDAIPKRVRATLADSALLFLGFRMDDWHFRVFFRTLMSQQGGDLRRRYAHIAVQITPEEGRILQPRLAQDYFEEYLVKGAAISVYWGSVEEFVQKLHKRWEGGDQ